MKGKFELFMGCLGNGITVCNKAVMEHGDYKQIAHISTNGKIKYYVSDGYIPIDDIQIIEKAAEKQRQKFLAYWNILTDIQKYGKLLDMCSHSDFMEIVHNKEMSLAEKVKQLENKYI